MIKTIYTYSLVCVLLFLTYSQMILGAISPSEKSVNGSQKNITVIKDIDLMGDTLRLDANSKLIFNGGIIKNGVLIGHNSTIVCKKHAFKNVTIKGTWNIPVIYSYWFQDLSYDNALRDVIALTSPNVHNKVIIGSGAYTMNIAENHGKGLVIDDNTELIINGKITLKPNSWTNYDIIHVKGNNIKISGKGMIVGDKHNHLGKKGEWGMGIMIYGANNVHVSDLTIKNCWGDCVYIGGNSHTVVVENCILDHGRRQGISVTSGKAIVLQDLRISNVGGTNPEYAIDVEPNKNGIVEDVLIKNVSADRCKGGFLVYGKSSGARIGKVCIENSNIANTTKMPIRVQKCDEIIIKGCTLPSALWIGRVIDIDECKKQDLRNNKMK